MHFASAVSLFLCVQAGVAVTVPRAEISALAGRNHTSKAPACKPKKHGKPKTDEAPLPTAIDTYAPTRHLTYDILGAATTAPASAVATGAPQVTDGVKPDVPSTPKEEKPDGGKNNAELPKDTTKDTPVDEKPEGDKDDAETPKDAPKEEKPDGGKDKEETPKDAPKEEAPKEAPKEEAPKDSPKEETPKQDKPSGDKDTSPVVGGKSISVTPHEQFSSSIGALGCKLNTNRVAYWPGGVSCDNFCVKVTKDDRTLHLLKIDVSGGAYDISYDAWNYLAWGASAMEKPMAGAGIDMVYEERPAEECQHLFNNGKLALSALHGAGFYETCKNEGSWIGKNSELYNIVDPQCAWGYDELCDPSCAHPLQMGAETRTNGIIVKNVQYPTGKLVEAQSIIRRLFAKIARP